jgi:transcriptional regulator with XRE-family HTH domain
MTGGHMDKLGKLVHDKRIKMNLTRKQLAKLIKCSEAFVRHIESSKTVPVSERLIKAVGKTCGLPKKKLTKAAKARNKVGDLYYRDYRNSN